MITLVTAPVGAEAQVTLPKTVRQALRLQHRGDLIGFVIDGKRVALTRIEPVPSSDPFTDEEWRVIDRLTAHPPAATLASSADSLRYLQRHLRTRRECGTPTTKRFCKPPSNCPDIERRRLRAP